MKAAYERAASTWLNGGPGAVRWPHGHNCVITAQESFVSIFRRFHKIIFVFLD